MTWRELAADQLDRLKDPLVIDVRSPCEHEAENIPQSLNVPLLSDDERAVVGTIYKNDGEVMARRHALTIISPKIPGIVERILSTRQTQQPVVIHCWRGGLRSEAVCSFLSIIGIDCWRLTGGYKAWRNMVLKEFAGRSYEFVPVVLDGLTGSGKTEVLRELGKRGHSVLDLEALANHRGSVFGGMGLGGQPTQKNFDAALWQALKSFGREPVLLEAESRKVGRLSLPDCIYERIGRGTKVLVTGSIDARAKRIVDDYANQMDESKESQAIMLLRSLKERLGAARVSEIEDLALAGRLHEAVQVLLVEYYDPLYTRQLERNRPFALEVCGDDIGKAAHDISGWLSRVTATA